MNNVTMASKIKSRKTKYSAIENGKLISDKVTVDASSLRVENDPNHLKPLTPFQSNDKTQVILLSFLLFVGVASIVAGTILVFVNMKDIASIQRGGLPYFTLPEALTFKNSRTSTNVMDYDEESIMRGNIRIVDPYITISKVIKGDSDSILIDLRSSESFKEKHVRNSINIPFSGEKEQDIFISKVEQLDKSKNVVLLPYSASSISGERAYMALDAKGMNVALMKQGWNELYNLPNMWVPETEWKSFGLKEWVEFKE